MRWKCGLWDLEVRWWVVGDFEKNITPWKLTYPLKIDLGNCLPWPDHSMFPWWKAHTEDITERKAPRKVSYHVDAENEWSPQKSTPQKIGALFLLMGQNQALNLQLFLLPSFGVENSFFFRPRRAAAHGLGSQAPSGWRLSQCPSVGRNSAFTNWDVKNFQTHVNILSIVKKISAKLICRIFFEPLIVRRYLLQYFFLMHV